MEKSDQEKFRVNIEELAREKGGQIKEMREKTAGILAVTFTILFIVLVVTPIFKPASSEYIKEVLLGVNALLGAAFGFYFSEKRLG